MRKTLFLCLSILLILLMLCSCAAQGTSDNAVAPSLADSADISRIGINIGTTQYDSLIKLFPDAEYTYMESYVDLTVALRSGRIDAFSADEPIARLICRKNDDLIQLDGDISREDYAFMLAKDNTALKEQIDEIILQYRADGTLDTLWEKWIESENPERLTLDISPETETPNGTLQVYAENDLEGFSFQNESGELVGYEIELISKIAQQLGMGCEFTGTDFSALIPGIDCGKADVALGCISVSEERAHSVLFTEPYHYGSSVLVTLDSSAAAQSEDEGFWQNLVQSFRSTFVTENRWKLILNGLLSTLNITVLSLVFGSIIGYFFSFVLRSKTRAHRNIASAISTIMDGMPLTVLLLVLYYVVFAKIDISPYSVALLGLSLDFGNTIAVLFNTGIAIVSDGQRRAAASLGYGKIAIFRKIVFPQAAAHVFGQYKGAVMGLVKNSAIVGYITVEDLTRISEIIRCRTYEAFFPLIVTAVIYFLLARLLMWLLSIPGNGLNPERRKTVFQGIDTSKTEGAAKLEQMHTNRDFQGKSIFSLRHLDVEYRGKHMLKDLNAEIQGGEVIAVLGPAGAGKSSLLYCMDCLIPTSAGEIWFAGENVQEKHYDMQKFREKVGIVFQNFNLFEHRTVLENVMMAPMDVLGMDKQSAYELSISFLGTVGMADKALCYPGELSGGQRQRAAIARTLAMTPDVILFDEPTYALDPSMRGEVRSVVKKLADSGYTILLATQDMQFAREVSSRVWYIEDGRICDDSPADVVFTNPTNPKTRAFILRMKSFHRVIDSKNFDYIGMTNDLTEFGHKLWWTKKQIYKVNLLFEELVLQLLLPNLPDSIPIDFITDYADVDQTTRLVLRYGGEDFDPMTACDEVSRALIQNSVLSMEHQYDGENCLTVTL